MNYLMVIYSENFEDITSLNQVKNDKQTLEEECMVDILVFMFKLGEFQLCVSRERSITIGYF
ncbi:MAG: hypothetical protein QG670_2427 [Thermoproteota archaeon]|nr:hypothetical protein [Thermoproteota archaeon]